MLFAHGRPSASSPFFWKREDADGFPLSIIITMSSISETDLNEGMELDYCSIERIIDYDRTRHLYSVFVVAAIGLIGIALPNVVSRRNSMELQDNVGTFINFFGTGIVISAAFVHMLPSSIEHLLDPCVSDTAMKFPSLPMLCVMSTVLAMHLVEFMIAREIGSRAQNDGDSDSEDVELAEPKNRVHIRHISRSISLATLSEDKTEDEKERQFYIVMIFEVGVIIHNFIVGLSLGVVNNWEFKFLVTAISFHQLLQGFALGASILQLSPNLLPKALTSSALIISAPIGAAVGIAAHVSSLEKNVENMFTVGIIEGMSAGTLIYTGVVELLTYGLTLNPQYSMNEANHRSVIYALLGLYSGASVLSILGRWS